MAAFAFKSGGSFDDLVFGKFDSVDVEEGGSMWFVESIKQDRFKNMIGDSIENIISERFNYGVID